MNALIRLEHVCVVRDGRRVLDDLSLALAPGERLALVGSNGAGKTTLLRTIVGLQRATGEIFAFGMRRHSEAEFREVRARAAYLFQDPDDQLFCPTVIDDVAFGPLNLGMRHAQAMALAREILGELDLGHLADRLTHRLSGGEKRLVSLAAVLAMRPEVLLLDEPTNALDDAYLERMLAILSRLPVAMIIASHDWALLERLTDRAAVLRGGRLIPAMLHRHGQWTEQVHLHELAPGASPQA